MLMAMCIGIDGTEAAEAHDFEDDYLQRKGQKPTVKKMLAEAQRRFDSVLTPEKKAIAKKRPGKAMKEEDVMAWLKEFPITNRDCQWYLLHKLYADVFHLTEDDIHETLMQLFFGDDSDDEGSKNSNAMSNGSCASGDFDATVPVSPADIFPDCRDNRVGEAPSDEESNGQGAASSSHSIVSPGTDNSSGDDNNNDDDDDDYLIDEMEVDPVSSEEHYASMDEDVRVLGAMMIGMKQIGNIDAWLAELQILTQQLEVEVRRRRRWPLDDTKDDNLFEGTSRMDLWTLLYHKPVDNPKDREFLLTECTKILLERIYPRENGPSMSLSRQNERAIGVDSIDILDMSGEGSLSIGQATSRGRIGPR